MFKQNFDGLQGWCEYLGVDLVVEDHENLKSALTPEATNVFVVRVG